MAKINSRPIGIPYDELYFSYEEIVKYQQVTQYRIDNQQQLFN